MLPGRMQTPRVGETLPAGCVFQTGFTGRIRITDHGWWSEGQ